MNGAKVVHIIPPDYSQTIVTTSNTPGHGLVCTYFYAQSSSLVAPVRRFADLAGVLRHAVFKSVGGGGGICRETS